MDKDFDTFLDLYFDGKRLFTYISLSGRGLFVRGFKKSKYALAPVREDYAACLIDAGLKALQYNITSYVIPFSGSGTFAYELQMHLNGFIHPGWRDWFLSKTIMNVNKSLNHHECSIKLPREGVKIFNFDIDPRAIKISMENQKSLESFIGERHLVDWRRADVYSMEDIDLVENIFLLLNPPWGERIGDENHRIITYMKIIDWIVNLKIRSSSAINGFLLCPDENVWSLAVRRLDKVSHSHHTIHYNQGGIHVRALYF